MGLAAGLRLVLLMLALELVACGARGETCALALQPAPEHIIVSGSSSYSPQSVFASDLDGDGALDVVTAAWTVVGWFHNNGSGVFAEPMRVIDAAMAKTRSAVAEDLNGDGAPDVVAVSEQYSLVTWYPNDGLGGFPLRVVLASNVLGSWSVVCADLDGNMAPDVLVAGSQARSILWFRNNGTGSFSAKTLVVATVGFPKSVAAADLNNDLALDVVYCTSTTNEIAWSKNYGNATFSRAFVVSSAVNQPWSVHAGDLAGDNDSALDIVSASLGDDTIAWYHNDGAGGFPDGRLVLTTGAFTPVWVQAVDVNNDGVLDVLAASEDDQTVSWFRGLGLAAFGPKLTVTSNMPGAKCARMGDMNGDGVADVVAGGYYTDKAAWYELSDSVTHPITASIVSNEVTFAAGLVAFDADLDGDIDIVAVPSDDPFIFFANQGAGSFEPGRQIAAEATDAAYRVAAGDVDGNGAIDLVFQHAQTGKLVWLPNDGSASFAAEPQSITSALPTWPAIGFIRLWDLDADGDLDCLWHSVSIFWARNNGSGGFSTAVLPSASETVAAGDIDKDGFVDLLVGSPLTQWLRNNGTGGFASAGSFLPHGYLIELGDLDADGWLDAVVNLAWYRNAANGAANGTFDLAPNVISENSVGESSLALGDLDNNNGVDVLVASNTENTVMWFANNGSGGFPAGARVLTTNAHGASDVLAVDLNNDGLLDVLASAEWSFSVFWFASQPSIGTRTSPSDAVRAQLPRECGLASDSIACVGARITALSSPCAAVAIPLPRLVNGCFDSPLRIRNNDQAQLALSGAAHDGGTTFACSTPGAQSLFVLPAGSQLALEHATVRVQPSAATSAPLRSVFTVCTSACGSTDSAALTLVNVSVSGFANAAPASDSGTDVGTGVVAVYGRSMVSLTHVNMTGNRCGARGAALTVLGTGAVVTARASHFDRNVATGQPGDVFGSGGGAIALVGAAQRLSLTDCTLDGNSADGGSGGAIVVRSAAAVVELTRVRMADNWAALAGGALALDSASAAQATLRECALERNTAAFGGAVAALSADLSGPTALVPDAIALMPASGLGGLTGGSVELGLGVTLTDSTARYGGALFACAARVNASAARVEGTTRASVAGGLAFRCNDLGTSAGSWLVLPANSSTPPSATHYGPVIATPPRTIALETAPPRATQSGATLGAGSVALLDSFGQRVVESSLALRTELAVPVGDVFGATALLVPSAARADYSLALIAPQVRGWPASLAGPTGGLELVLQVAIDAGGFASRVAGSPTLALALTVTHCAAGWGRVSSDDSSTPLVCAPCSGGTFSSAESAARADECMVCPVNSLQASGLANVTGVGVCVCERGFYAPAGATNVACVRCPAGGSCAGGTALPTAAPGYFPDGTVFVSCPRASACVGDGVCARGYTKRLCGSCARGFYALNDRCLPCRQGQTGLVVAVFVVLALVVTGALLWLNAVSSLAELKVVSATIGLAALQVMALFGKLSIDWGPLADGVLQVVSVLSLNVQLASPECSLSPGVDAWTLKWVLMLVLPVFAAVAVAFLAVALIWPLKLAGVPRLADLTMRALANASGRTWYQLLVLMQLPLTAAAMSPFGCRGDESGAKVVVDDPSRVCYDSRWWQLFAPALLTSVAYGFALPASVGFVLRRARGRLDDVSFNLHFGFLVGRFRRECYGAEAAVMSWKTMLVLATTFFASAESKVGAGALTTAGAMLALAHLRPFRGALHNWLAVGSLGAILSVLVVGTLDALVFRHVIAAAAIVALLAAILACIAIDVWTFAKSRNDANAQWKHADVTSHAFEVEVELDDAARSNSSLGSFTVSKQEAPLQQQAQVSDRSFVFE